MFIQVTTFITDGYNHINELVWWYSLKHVIKIENKLEILFGKRMKETTHFYEFLKSISYIYIYVYDSLNPSQVGS